MAKKLAKKSFKGVKQMSSDDLCKALSGIAAFHVEDDIAQAKIYEAIRRLQAMEKAAIDAGILPKRL
jgi:hypothetical protein